MSSSRKILSNSTMYSQDFSFSASSTLLLHPRPVDWPSRGDGEDGFGDVQLLGEGVRFSEDLQPLLQLRRHGACLRRGAGGLVDLLRFVLIHQRHLSTRSALV